MDDGSRASFEGLSELFVFSLFFYCVFVRKQVVLSFSFNGVHASFTGASVSSSFGATEPCTPTGLPPFRWAFGGVGRHVDLGKVREGGRCPTSQSSSGSLVVSRLAPKFGAGTVKDRNVWTRLRE